MADDIARAFVEGLYEVYSVLYQEILFYPIDPSNLTNVYGESKGKKFLDPVTIFAKVKKAPRGPGRDENEEDLDILDDDEEWCPICGCNKSLSARECPSCGC